MLRDRLGDARGQLRERGSAVDDPRRVSGSGRRLGDGSAAVGLKIARIHFARVSVGSTADWNTREARGYAAPALSSPDAWIAGTT